MACGHNAGSSLHFSVWPAYAAHVAALVPFYCMPIISLIQPVFSRDLLLPHDGIRTCQTPGSSRWDCPHHCLLLNATRHVLLRTLAASNAHIGIFAMSL